jgi:RNA polymerase sigma factor (sigma-70 family)
MRYHLATEEQLKAIISYDTDCPSQLMVGVVTELIRRGFFDGLIVKKAKAILGNFETDEVKQTVYIGLYQAATLYKKGKITFYSMAHIVMDRRIKTTLTVRNQKRNHFFNKARRIEELESDSHFDIESGMNVEKTVINKIIYDGQMAKLTEKERDIIEKFIEGHSINYIAKAIYGYDQQTIRYHFAKALKKMGITDYKIGRAGRRTTKRRKTA